MNHNHFLSLYSKYKKFIYTIIKFFLEGRDGSEDIFQQTWMEIYKNAESFKGNSGFSTWIYSLTRNIIFDHFKKTKTFPAANIEVSCESHENAVLSKLDLAAAVFSLTAEQQQVIFLRYTLGMSYEEIAAETGVPVKTVKSRLFESKINLRKKMKK
ncbi:MAG TPA: hypothetical protein DC017_16360 [Candidatus Wallbacteria bacterium]|nr:hypothetical protein [Candidatus Wallbacteria bacterium]